MARGRSLRRLSEDLDFEIDLFAGIVRGRLARDPGYLAVQQIPGIGPVFEAEQPNELLAVRLHPLPAHPHRGS